jgi:hypothetical protein
VIAETYISFRRHTLPPIIAMALSIRPFPLHLLISMLPVLAALPAAAVSVTVNGLDYDVTFFEGSYADHSLLFQAPPAGLMPWWSDPSGDLASQFAFQVYGSLGSGSVLGYGPVFAYLYDAGSDTLEGWVQSITDLNVQDIQNPSRTASINYAILNNPPPSPEPVPSPLPLFGAASAYRVSRTLRQKMLSRHDPISL